MNDIRTGIIKAVVRRGRFDSVENTGDCILREWTAIYGGKRKPIAKAVLDYWDKVEEDQERVSPSAYS